jgi:hypothetical protein
LRKMFKKGLLWPMVMFGSLIIIAIVIISSYMYFGVFGTNIEEKISSPSVDGEGRTFLVVLLQKKIAMGSLADGILAAEKGSSTYTYDNVKNDINEYLFVRFGKNVEWNLYVNDVEKTDNQLTGFVGERKFSVYLPSTNSKNEPQILKVVLEVNDDPWDNEFHAPFVGGLD